MQTMRNSLLARVHLLKKELGLSDVEYHDMLLRGFYVTSSAKLTDDQLAQFAATMTGMREHKPTNQNRASKMIWTEWYALRPYLEVQKQDVFYLFGFARRHAPNLRMRGAQLDFDQLSVKDANSIIRGLIQSRIYYESHAEPVPF